MATTSPSPPPSISGDSKSPSPAKPSRWAAARGVMRRSSTALSFQNIVRAASPSPSEREARKSRDRSGSNAGDRNSDSASITGASKPPSLKHVDTSPLLSGDYVTPSPIAESPMREAAETPPAPSALAKAKSPLAAAITADSVPATPISTQPASLVAEPEEMPSSDSKAEPAANAPPEESVPRYTTLPAPANPPQENVAPTEAQAAIQATAPQSIFPIPIAVVAPTPQAQPGAASPEEVDAATKIQNAFRAKKARQATLSPGPEPTPAPVPQVIGTPEEHDAAIKIQTAFRRRTSARDEAPISPPVIPSASVSRSGSVSRSIPAALVPGGVATATHDKQAYFDMPAPRAVAPTENSTAFWNGGASGQGSVKARVSKQPSIASLASSAGWGKQPVPAVNVAESAPNVPTINEDPFADPKPPALLIPVDPRSPQADEYSAIVMPLPRPEDVMAAQQANNALYGGYDATGNGSANGHGNGGPAERAPLLSRSQPSYTNQAPPSARSAATPASIPQLHTIGWIEYVLPDAATYYVHPTLRVVTDIDLRNERHLNNVMGYLDRGTGTGGEGFKVPQGCELWVRDAAKGRRRDCVPVRNWVDHVKRLVSFEAPSDRDGEGGHHMHEDDKLDGRYRYWSFMETHPAHSGLSMAAHAEATDVLTWCYTERILPPAGPVTPPFTQAENQELMNMLRSFGTTPDPSGIQTIVHTRLVARILLRMAHWRQTHFRPHRPLPKDIHVAKSHSQRKNSFFRVIFDFIVSLVCLGIPYMFLERSSHLHTDIESGLHSPGPMLVIGACSCLVAAILLSASVSFLSFPGLDNIARVAACIAILCSAASMTASVISLFRYKADLDSTVYHYDMAGKGLMTLSKRSVVLALPLVFLAYSVAGFVTAIVLYTLRTASPAPPGTPPHLEDWAKWTIVGTLGGLAGVLALAAIVSRK
ncbi:hypothetical protein HWV62_11654 [Athelia sp. TMB]|nr:hypothetical protein HWV62_11654 [Athelia sp. TMB]